MKIDDQTTHCEGESYTVQAGDTLYAIAKKYNLSVKDLIATNPPIDNPDQIFVGQVICIPSGIERIEKKAVLLSPPQSPEYEIDLKRAGGVMLYQQLNKNEYDVTVFAVGLPDPESLESTLDFDSYAVMIRSFDRERGGTYYSVLNETVSDDQSPTWSLALGKLNLSNTKVLGIVAYDSEGFVPGAFVLTRGI